MVDLGGGGGGFRGGAGPSVVEVQHSQASLCATSFVDSNGYHLLWHWDLNSLHT